MDDLQPLMPQYIPSEATAVPIFPSVVTVADGKELQKLIEKFHDATAEVANRMEQFFAELPFARVLSVKPDLSEDVEEIEALIRARNDAQDAMLKHICGGKAGA